MKFFSSLACLVAAASLLAVRGEAASAKYSTMYTFPGCTPCKFTQECRADDLVCVHNNCRIALASKPDYVFSEWILAGNTQAEETSVYEVIEEGVDGAAATQGSSLYAHFGYSSKRRVDEGNGPVMFLNNSRKGEEVAFVVTAGDSKHVYLLQDGKSCGDTLEYKRGEIKSVVAYAVL
jgi:hypothetical protein